jgi:endonuclease/exonuclease/phosphatase family metal-dependent hydrolase
MPFYEPLKYYKQIPSADIIWTIHNRVDRDRVVANLLHLRDGLQAAIPRKTARDHLLLATWNIRKLNEHRTTESLYYIAEVLAKFDLIAVQEVISLKAFNSIVYLMGKHWDYITTDATYGNKGGNERLIFLYDTRKVSFQKLAGEIVLPETLLKKRSQFARTPYIAAFQSGWFKFNICTVHIYYGDQRKQAMREWEIDMIAGLVAKQRKKEQKTHILLGDFNIATKEDTTYKNIKKHKFHIPDAHIGSNIGQNKDYDQIAFNLFENGVDMPMFKEGEKGKDGLPNAGVFNVFDFVYTAEEFPEYAALFPEDFRGRKDKAAYFTKTWRTFQISDHLPLWTRLKIDFSDEYLKSIQHQRQYQPKK